MARTVRKIDVVNQQSFKATVYGLNVNTLLNVYYDSTKVSAADLEPLNGKAGDPISSDSNGKAEFIYYLRNPYTGNLLNNPESLFIEFLSLDAGLKTFIIVDKASVNTDTLPDNYTTISRCYAEIEIDKAYEVTFTDVKDWGDQTETLTQQRQQTITA